MHHLETALGPLTHAEVSEALHHLGFDRATIYRNLTELTEAALASRVELGDHVWRFEAKRAPTSSARPAAQCSASNLSNLPVSRENAPAASVASPRFCSKASARTAPETNATGLH